MRVMHVALTDQVFPRFHHRWIKALVDAGHEVCWVSEDWGNTQALADAGVQHMVATMARGLHPLRVVEARRNIRRAIRAFDPDVLVTEQTVPGFLARTAFKRPRHKILHIVHSWPWHDLTPRLVKAVALRLERRASRHTDHHVVINAEDHAEGVKKGLVDPDRSTQMAVGIDPDQYGKRPSPKRVEAAREQIGLQPGDGPVFLFVGRIVEYKGVFDLLQAFAIVQESLPDAVLVVVGKPDQRTGSQRTHGQFLAQVHHNQAVRHFPMIDDLPALHAAADVFVMPSRYEGLGLVYIEANAMGTPAIGYNVRGVREAIDDGRTGHLIKVGNIEALAASMTLLGGDAEARRRLGESGRDRWRAQFDNAAFSQAMMQRVQRLGRATGAS